MWHGIDFGDSCVCAWDLVHMHADITHVLLSFVFDSCTWNCAQKSVQALTWALCGRRPHVARNPPPMSTSLVSIHAHMDRRNLKTQV